MGDAYTAIADDDNTLFYNPAALGRHHGVSLSFLNPTIEATNYLKYSDKFENFPSDPAEITERVLGLPLYLRLGVAPALKMQHFGFSLFANSKTSMVLENAAHPLIDINYNYDRGFILGYAFTLGNSGKSKSKSGQSTSLGVSLKRITREAINGKYPLFGYSLIGSVSEAETFADIRDGLGFTKGSGWGIDLAAEQNFYRGNSRLGMAIALLDVGDTRFEKTEGSVDVPVQPMNLSMGTAFSQDYNLFEYSLSADIHPILEPRNTITKLHFGARAGIPLWKLYVGWNGGYFSYGTSIDILLFRLTAGFYGIEVGGSEFKQKKAERAFISLNLLSMHWDM